jgi:mRNA interferase MazF
MASPLTPEPRRGEVWLAALGAVRPGEPGKHRPAIVVSADRIIAGTTDEPIVVVPLSSTAPPSALRPQMIEVEGLDRPSCAVCGAVRGLARSRLLRRLGVLPPAAFAEVERTLALVLDFELSRVGSPAGPG